MAVKVSQNKHQTENLQLQCNVCIALRMRDMEIELRRLQTLENLPTKMLEEDIGCTLAGKDHQLGGSQTSTAR